MPNKSHGNLSHKNLTASILSVAENYILTAFKEKNLAEIPREEKPRERVLPEPIPESKTKPFDSSAHPLP